MLKYNTQSKNLVLPEYGRNIQSMVDHCVTIEDREERTKCAYSIVAAMANLFPELKSGGEYNSKLWDHLAIMSGFALDIDYPVEIVKRDNLSAPPLPIPGASGSNPIRRRHYGRTIQSMIDKVSEMDESEERTELIRLTANQMKKTLLSSNRDQADDQRIFRDMTEMSSGRIKVDDASMKLCDYIIPQTPTGKKRKKK
ncbi:MAG: DUF4290 domain-containing protein [Bacteroides sp.]|nr:DUF4290 domain-containing protein [Bacteroides sp.]